MRRLARDDVWIEEMEISETDKSTIEISSEIERFARKGKQISKTSRRFMAQLNDKGYQQDP